MKQIINHVLYDTHESDFITNYYASQCKRELYKTKSGAFFAVEWDCGNSSISRKQENFVKDLLGRINIEKYIELFGVPESA